MLEAGSTTPAETSTRSAGGQLTAENGVWKSQKKVLKKSLIHLWKQKLGPPQAGEERKGCRTIWGTGSGHNKTIDQPPRITPRGA